VLVTGAGGSLGPHVVAAAQARGWQVLAWDRRQVPPEDEAACARHLAATPADAVLHLALGSERWAAQIAAHAAAHGLPFVLTGSAMVFHHQPDGPHAPHHERNAQDDYGRYKARVEELVRQAHPGATVARIGWQIDPRPEAAPSSNHMLATLDRWQREEGAVRASRLWRPACSFMPDTAAALLDLLDAPEAGAVHLDSNARAGHSFDVIVAALAERFERSAWRIEPTDAYRHDQRLVGDEDRLPPLAARLPRLQRASVLSGSEPPPVQS
jgi:dTDP-4-dehydrorhamnose reductase